jgi:hypothetical protein
MMVTVVMMMAMMATVMTMMAVVTVTMMAVAMAAPMSMVCARGVRKFADENERHNHRHAENDAFHDYQPSLSKPIHVEGRTQLARCESWFSRKAGAVPAFTLDTASP